ncbi:lysylphosphatidylglycerol synthase transmembrane domain-containing protein [Actinophytocola sediminis]
MSTVSEQTPEVAVTATPAPVSRKRVWFRRVMLVLLLTFAVTAIVANRDGLLEALRETEPWAIPVAFVPGLIALLTSLGAWRSLLADVGSRLPWRAAARIFFLSQLGKYVPGSVWSILTQMELSQQHNVPKRSILMVGIVSIAVAVTSGLTLAVVMLPFAVPDAIARYWWVLLVLPVLLSVLHPAVLTRCLGIAMKVLRREPLPKPPSWRGLGTTAGFQFGTWMLLGLHAWILLIGLGASPLAALPVAIGGYALAYSIGQLAIGLPAGAGVREAGLTLVMSTVVPAPAALLLALLSRALLTLVDLTMAGTQYVIGRRVAKKAADQGVPATES